MLRTDGTTVSHSTVLNYSSFRFRFLENSKSLSNRFDPALSAASSHLPRQVHPPASPSPSANSHPSNTPLPVPAMVHNVRYVQNTVRQELSALQSELSALRNELYNLQSHDPLLPLQQVRKPSQISAALIRRHSLDTLLALAGLCTTGPLGMIGTRRALRVVACRLLTHILSRQPHNTTALCLKGELLLPYIHYGFNDPRPPRKVLQQAYSCFDTAAIDADRDALFLKGRWLLSMETLHRDPAQSATGQACVKSAASQGCARALVFLAHRYENPQLDRYVSFADDVPKGKREREKFILDLYMRAAEKGDKDALNDVGTSYAQGYGGLDYDFDKAVHYYVRAINAGSVYAYDNLGTHYETGMGGRHPDRVDYRKALYYYKQGTKQYCPKCAHNLGAAYEEGMQGVLEKDVKKAEAYYWHSMLLADSCNDLPTAARSSKDLAALLVTRIKLRHPADTEVVEAKRKLAGLISPAETVPFLATVDADIAAAVKGRSGKLKELLGEESAKAVVKRAKELVTRVRSNPQPEDMLLYNHVMGVEYAGTEERKRKNKRTSGARKRRRT